MEFGRVWNRVFRQLYPPSLVKTLLGDYGIPRAYCCFAMGMWPWVRCYSAVHVTQWFKSGVFLSEQFPYLATSYLLMVYMYVTSLGDGKFGVVEVKCPYKHHKKTIKEACKGSSFCLSNRDSQITLDCQYDHNYWVTGQLALTSAEFSDLAVWTEIDIHIEQVKLNVGLRAEMKDKLSHFCLLLWKYSIKQYGNTV